MRSPACLLAVSALITVVGGGRPESATVVRFTWEGICRDARTIAHVRVVRVEALRDEARGEVITRTRLQVVEPVKGEPTPHITLTLPGGGDGAGRVELPGMPRFRVGEEAVVFLSAPGPTGSAWPMGLSQGCYAVRRRGGGEPQVRLGPGPKPDGVLSKPAGEPVTMALPTFLSRVRQTVSEKGERP